MNIFDNLPKDRSILFYDHRSVTLLQLRRTYEEDEYGFLTVNNPTFYYFDLCAFVEVGPPSDTRH